MVKLFGFRISPFFFFILGLECLAFLSSIYIGVLLYKGAPGTISFELINNTIYMGLFLVILLSILTPGFFSQVKAIDKIKKSVNEEIKGLLSALLTMSIIVFASTSNMDSKHLFAAAIVSACIGLSVNKAGVLSKYWRFLIRSGVN